MARRKVIVIGLDGLIPGLVRKFAQEGAMPRMARLMRSGSFSEMLPATPTDTPTNWTSIATGAWTGTHGVNSFGIHYAGESFWKPSVNGQNIFPKFPDFGSITKHALNRQCRAEYIWQRAAKEGVDCLLVNFPGAWPPNVRQHAAIVDMSGPAGHSTTRIARPARIALWGKNKHENALVAGTGNWQSIPRTWEPLAHGALPLPHSRSGGLEMLLVRRPDGFALCVSRVRNASRRICCLRPGQSSPWVRDEYDFTFDCRWHWISSYFNPDPVTLPGIFKLYLEEEDGRLFLYKSATYNPKGWASPSSIAQELIDRHLARVGHSDTVRTSLVDNDIFEPRSLEADGIADMCGHLAGRWPWRLLMTQFHAPDGLHHSMLQMVHPPAPRYLPEQEGEGWRQLREEHAVLDKFVGKVVDACADREHGGDCGLRPRCDAYGQASVGRETAG